MLEPPVKLWWPGSILGIPLPDLQNLPPSPEYGDHHLFFSNTHTTLKSMSNTQPNFPKWIVITVIHAYSSCPFVGGFCCERLCIIFSTCLWFENWSHGVLLHQLVLGMLFNYLISSFIFLWTQLHFVAEADCSMSRICMSLLFVLIVCMTGFSSKCLWKWKVYHRLTWFNLRQMLNLTFS